MSVPATSALDEVAEVTSGQGAPQGSDKFSNKGTPFIRAGSLEPLLAGKPQPSLELIAPSVAADHRMRLFPEGTVVFAKSGMSAKLGRVYCLSAPAFVVSHLAAIIPSPRLDSHFLRRWFECNPPSHLIPNDSYPSISLKAISELQVPTPPIAVQKRIAAILDAADALRAKRRESIEQLDSLVQATFLEMFGDPVTNPKGWPITCLRHIADDTFRNGLSPSTKGSVAGQVLTLGAITSGAFLFAESKAACFDRPPAAAQTLSERTFLICRGNGSRELVGIGAFPDRTSTDVCFPDTMIGVTPDCGIVHGRYLHQIWNSRCVRTQVEGMARTTNGTYKVNQQMLATVAMPLPPLDLQIRFATIVEAIEQQKARMKAHLAELDTLFASLQSRAFNGELVA